MQSQITLLCQDGLHQMRKPFRSYDSLKFISRLRAWDSNGVSLLSEMNGESGARGLLTLKSKGKQEMSEWKTLKDDCTMPPIGDSTMPPIGDNSTRQDLTFILMTLLLWHLKIRMKTSWEVRPNCFRGTITTSTIGDSQGCKIDVQGEDNYINFRWLPGLPNWCPLLPNCYRLSENE